MEAAALNSDRPNLVTVQLETEFGPMEVAWQRDAVCRLAWVADTSNPKPLTNLTALTPAQQNLAQDLVDYARGIPVAFDDIELALPPGTPFLHRIWRQCRKIRYGEKITYGQLAAMSGRPGAARAVGSAMAKNQIPLIIPCHRVVAAGNRLGGFSSPQGPRQKKRLLELEANGIKLLNNRSRSNRAFTSLNCHP